LNLAADDLARAVDAPYGAILKAQVSLLAAVNSGRDKHKLGGLPFQPTADGAVLPSRAIDEVRNGSAKDIPLLTGTTREEWKLFTAADPRLRLMSAGNLAERVAKIAREATPALLAAYSDGSPFERFNAVMTDKNFTVPAMRLLEAQASRAPVFAYRFDWRSPFLGGMMGSCHALELGFVFGTYNQKLAGAFFGTGVAAEALASAMMDSWVAFACKGDPSTPAIGQWPRHDVARDVMIFGDGDPHVLRAPNEERIRAWDTVPERKIGP
jgi:para-nitrobenzyl esterase